MKAVLLCQATLKHHIAAIPTLSTRWGQIQLCQHDQLYDDDEAVCWVILHGLIPCLVSVGCGEFTVLCGK